MTNRTTTLAGATLLLAAMVPVAAYHIDATVDTATALGPGDWTLALGSVVQTCESNGPADDRNDNPTPLPGGGGLCTTGENDATGTFPTGQGMPMYRLMPALGGLALTGSEFDEADEPAAGDWLRLDVCAETVAQRGRNAGDFRYTDVEIVAGAPTPDHAAGTVTAIGDTDEGEAVVDVGLIREAVPGTSPALTDDLYADVNNNGAIDAGDYRYTAVTIGLFSYAAGTTILATQADDGAADTGVALLIADPDGTGTPDGDDDLYADIDGNGVVAGANNYVLPCDDAADLKSQHGYTARIGAFQCVVPTTTAAMAGQADWALYYDRLYAWYSYDGDGWYTEGDDVGPHTGDAFGPDNGDGTDDAPAGPFTANGVNGDGDSDNEDAYQGHVTVFLSSSAADHRSAVAGGFSVQGSVSVEDVTALPGGRVDFPLAPAVGNECGGSPSTDEDGNGGAADVPAGPVFRGPY